MAIAPHPSSPPKANPEKVPLKQKSKQARLQHPHKLHNTKEGIFPDPVTHVQWHGYRLIGRWLWLFDHSSWKGFPSKTADIMRTPAPSAQASFPSNSTLPSTVKASSVYQEPKQMATIPHHCPSTASATLHSQRERLACLTISVPKSQDQGGSVGL